MSIEKSNKFEKSGDYIQSLERGLKVIQAFSQDTPTLTISEVAKITGLSRPTARRILLTLEHLGFAESKNGNFSLTARILTLGYSYISSRNIWEISQPIITDFVTQTGESSSISVLDGTEIIYVVRIPTKRIMRINLNVGSRLPAYATSMGHVLLAGLSNEELENRLGDISFERFSNNTITDKQQLVSVLDKVREEGWVMVDQQLEEGLRSIAVPIKNSEGKVIAAINCSTHAGRISKETLQEEFLPLLFETADKISKAISTLHNSSYF